MTSTQTSGTVTCANCESVYRLAEAGDACVNCGAPLATSAWLDTSVEPTYLGVLSFLKPVNDLVTKAYEGTDMLAEAGGRTLQERVSGPVMCGWCRQQYEARPASPNCASCGGVLPKPPGAEAGDPPPRPPRRLPSQFFLQLYVKQNFGGLIGLALIVLGIPSLYFPLVGVPMLLLGAVIAYSNFVTARRRHVALARGAAARGQIERVERWGDKSQGGYSQMYRVWFRFESGGRPYTGMKYTYDPSITNHFEHEPIWVVCLPGSPKYHDIWPPLA